MKTLQAELRRASRSLTKLSKQTHWTTTEKGTIWRAAYLSAQAAGTISELLRERREKDSHDPSR